MDSKLSNTNSSPYTPKFGKKSTIDFEKMTRFINRRPDIYQTALPPNKDNVIESDSWWSKFVSVLNIAKQIGAQKQAAIFFYKKNPSSTLPIRNVSYWEKKDYTFETPIQKTPLPGGNVEFVVKKRWSGTTKGLMEYQRYHEAKSSTGTLTGILQTTIEPEVQAASEAGGSSSKKA